MVMIKLREELENELKEIKELEEFYLEQLDKSYEKWIDERLNELRIEIRTYEKVLDKIDESDKE